MSLPDAVAVIMFAAIVMYAVFGGADFGSGVWDLLAGGPKRGASTRRLIDHAIGPVWEANHVWLIFVLVFLWTGFPEPYAALMRSLAVPFWLVGLGVVMRGAGFALRKYSPTLRAARLAGIVFAVASLLTPFFLGSIAGTIASGRIGLDTGALPLSTVLEPAPLLGGILAVLTCTFLAGVFLLSEASRLGDNELVSSLRGRVMASGVLTGTVALAGVFPLRADAETLADGLDGRAAIIVIFSAVSGLATLLLLRAGRYKVARITAAGAVASIVAGWGIGQYPWILVDNVTIEASAGADATLLGLLIAAGAAAVLVVPALVALYVLADSDRIGTS